MAHGSPDRSDFGEDSLEVTSLDSGYHSINMPGVMAKDAKRVFVSCSTGREVDGKYCVARKSAAVLGRVAIAPKKPVGFAGLRVVKNGDAVDAHVDYVRIARKRGRWAVIRTDHARFDGDMDGREEAMTQTTKYSRDKKHVRDKARHQARQLAKNTGKYVERDGLIFNIELGPEGEEFLHLGLSDEETARSHAKTL